MDIENELLKEKAKKLKAYEELADMVIKLELMHNRALDAERERDEIQKKYDELNDFSNSQLRKVLEENAKLKELVTN